MKLEEVILEKVDTNETEFRTLNLTDPEKLKHSIEELGLINPLKLLKSGNRYRILTGWLRYEALLSLNHTTASAFVYDNGEITLETACKLIYTDNKHRSSELIKAELLAKLMSDGSYDEQYVVSKILSFLDLNPTSSNLKKYLSLADLKHDIKISYLEGHLSFEQLNMLCGLRDTSVRDDVYGLFLKEYRFNNNESRDLIKDLITLIGREKTTIKNIKDKITEKLGNKINKNDIRKELKRVCYPKLTRVEKIYMEKIDDLGLDNNTRIVNHPYFESNEVEARIKFAESGELSSAIKNLQEGIKSGTIDRLLGIIREGK